MRNEIVAPGAGELSYEIRNIVTVAEKVQSFGVKINWENIGDPIVKGEDIPAWMKEIVAKEVMENDTYGYCPTRGVLETRQFICEMTNKLGGAQITPDDIIFFNGLGDAIAKVYGNLRPESRILMPSPTYTTHSIGEAGHANAVPVCYRLKPEDNWYPDMEDLECHVKYNPQISGIMIINPDNPTGMVYPRAVLEKIVAIAKQYDLFIIADEVYSNIVYNGEVSVPICEVIGDVPAIALKGISKEVPWPGSRCGWIEVYNGEKDPRFKKYINSILSSKMNEVCSTTLPQRCIPALMQHPEYPTYLKERIARYEKASNITYQALKEIPGLAVNRTNGAFYMAVSFRKGVLNDRQSLPIEKPELQELVEGIVNAPGVSLDKRFVYYVLANTGICVVPLSSFNTDLLGFRVTLLERDEDEVRRIYRTLTEKIDAYLKSA
ncbi:pyridoxal phosphate-dependent aminotransferase [Geomesophilobacter sediminis]|uniref:alanine transaminase n=1 Tax=Geomesophilobacter sediminis TaxID=2798584 RepID=A0A8J7M3D9_9BACT|nr:pyridoxal phosphate-dependent aminotransferase [Geomesophilobacter sediminis]MBJ6727902.1 pyridoxal phosphate-dependent aminotransferase [Geomesophilobacter sediminis]